MFLVWVLFLLLNKAILSTESYTLNVFVFVSSFRTATFLPVEYIIRNKFSYPGGSYGTYGGYDIILIKLRNPVSSLGPETTPVLLPRDQNYPDLGPALIAGYGRYRRAPCEVGRSGPDKFEFCGIEKSCTKNSRVSRSSFSTISTSFYNYNRISGYR